MNKIFKVVWSEARNAYVVVSEIAKNHGSKSCSTKKLLTMLIATGVMTCASMAPAMAAPASDDANKGWNLSVNGAITAGTEVQPGDYVDFNGDQNVSVSKDVKDGVKIVKVELNKDIDVNSVQTNALNSKYNLSVGTMAENGIMPFFVNSTGDFYAAHNKFSVDKDGNVNANSIQTNALNSKYNLSVGTMAENGIMPFFVNSTGAFYAAGNKFSVDKDGNANANSIQTNALNAKYNLSVGTANENGTMPFFVNSNGAFYGANGSFVVDKDGNVTAGNVVLNNGVFYKNSALRDGELFIGDNDGNYSQITPKSAKLGQVTIDEKGNIAGVNSIQTNALNAKYNLSVGTANENGTMPFFVNSNGAFYGANGSFVVDKDGNVTAGNVVLNNGVFYKNSALRDGELFIGDNDGNYSQITTKGAKLGKVTVAEDGKISGVAAGEVSKTSTDAINGSQLNQTNENVAQNKADIAANKTAIEANRADIDKNKADIAANKTAISDLNTRVDSVAKQHTTVKAVDNNITVAEGTNADGGKEYKVALSNKISVDSVTAGDTTISGKGLEIKDGPSVTKDGINAGNKKVTNVAAGELSETSKDVVNY